MGRNICEAFQPSPLPLLRRSPPVPSTLDRRHDDGMRGRIAHFLTGVPVSRILRSIIACLCSVSALIALAAVHTTAHGATPNAALYLGEARGSARVAVGDFLYFNRGSDLMKSDGTVGGTVVLRSNLQIWGGAAVIGETFYFAGIENESASALWRSDGTPAGTVRVSDLGAAGGALPSGLQAVGSAVYFHAHGPWTGLGIFRSDGTAAGTLLLRDGLPPAGGVEPGSFAPAGMGKVVFTAYDGASNDLWVTDGTPGGTIKLQAQVSSDFAAVGGVAIYSKGNALWRTDGTASGTQPLAPAGGLEVAAFSTSAFSPSRVISLGSFALFRGRNPGGQYELWRSDGTSQGTFQVADLCPQPDCPSSPYNFVAVDGAAYFVASSLEAGRELWRSDGTAAGTYQVKDVAPGDAMPSFLTPSGQRLFFLAQDPHPAITKSLWRSNGTAIGTRLSADFDGISGVFDWMDGTPRGVFLKIDADLWFLPSTPPEQDLDGSGTSDILYRNASTGAVWRLRMDGLSVADSAPAHQEPDLNWRIAGSGDFDGNGISDLLWRHATSGEVYLQRYGVGGVPSGGAPVYIEPDDAWKIVATPDLDGDGKADIVWWNSSTGMVWAMLMDGLSIAAQGPVYAEPNTAWRIVAVGDFSGSGKRNQLVWRNGLSGLVYLMTVNRVGNVFTQSGRMIYSEPNPRWRILDAADADGDGRTDLYWRNESTGQVYLMLMNGTAIGSASHVYTEPNLAWQIAAIGDYDGNGRADLLWRNDTTGELYLMLMDGFAIASQQTIHREPDTAWQVLGLSLNDD